MLAGTAGVERKRCVPLLCLSLGPPLTPLQHLEWWNQSVPSPIHWALSHSSMNTLSLPSLSLQCILVASLLNSLPLSPSLWTSNTTSHLSLPPLFRRLPRPPLTFPFSCALFLQYCRPFHLSVHCIPYLSLPVSSLSSPLFPGSVPGGFATHFKSLHCLDMPTYSTSSLHPALLSHTQYPWVLWIFLSSTRASSCVAIFTWTLAPYLRAPANIVSKWLLGWWFMHAVTHHALLL